MVSSRKELKEYCLRKLGFPVINIEVAEQQVDDRIDDALELYQEKHFDATEEKWVSYTMTQNDIDTGYIHVPDNVIEITSLLPVQSLHGLGEFFAAEVGSSFGFDTLSSWNNFDGVSYYMNSLNYNTMKQMMHVVPSFEWIRHRKQLKIHRNLNSLAVGAQMAIQVVEIVDPETSGVYNDKWLKEYVTALVKKQWGSNTKKMGQIQMLGGVTMNGQEIFDEAVAEIEKLEEALTNIYQEPVPFIFG